MGTWKRVYDAYREGRLFAAIKRRIVGSPVFAAPPRELPPLPSFAALIEKYRRPAGELRSLPGCWTNFLGVHTSSHLYKTTVAFDGVVIADKFDGALWGLGEYGALLAAIETGDRDAGFACVELGAAHGPWLVNAGVVALRERYAKVSLTGVEAAPLKLAEMSPHLARNGLANHPKVAVRMIGGAAWHAHATLRFPAAVGTNDYGAAAAEAIDKDERDYRGFVLDFEPVQGFTLNEICEGLDRIDLMHCDIQGAERMVVPASMKLLNERVRIFAIGCHSRTIDGVILELFFREGWQLLHEAPTQFEFNPERKTLEGMVTIDGEQVWRNPRLA